MPTFQKSCSENTNFWYFTLMHKSSVTHAQMHFHFMGKFRGQNKVPKKPQTTKTKPKQPQTTFINWVRNDRQGQRTLSKALKALSFRTIHHISAEMLGFITEPLHSYHHNMTAVKTITLNKPFQVFSGLEKYLFLYYQIFVLVS